MKKILSISIAAYNVEKTIEECLDSFLPSKHLEELELLVVNDGSHDRTVEIVSRYEKKYPGVVRLINKENGGHGSTINTSLRLATGKFYKVLDGDDWVDPVELDKLVDALETTDADMVANDYMEVYPDHTRRMSHRRGRIGGKIYSFDELFPDRDFNNDIFAMHETTILTERLRDVGMKIQEHCFYADTEFIFYVGLAARTVEFNDSCAYQYRLGSAGQSVSPEGVYKHIEDLICIEYNLIRLYYDCVADMTNHVRQSYLHAIIDTRYNMLFSWFTAIIQKADKDALLVDFLKKLHQNYPDIESSFHLSLANKFVAEKPESRVPWMRNFRKTGTFKMLRAVKHLIKPVPKQ